MLAQTATTIPPTDIDQNVSQESNAIIETMIEALPRLAIATVIVIVAVVVARLLRRFLRPRLEDARGESFGRVMSNLANYAVTSAGLILGFTVLFPSVKPVDLIAGLGVFSIAIGFAFQDILSNLLAGLLLLIRQPFENGDQIEVGGQRGTVQGITIRETQIKTFAGEKIIIPNAEVYQSVIRVQTAYGPKRTDIAIGLEDHEDLDRAASVVLEAVRDLEGVHDDPEPQAFFTEFGASTTNFDLRYWTDPEQANIRAVQDRVVRAVGKALKENSIPMPSPIRELDARDSFTDAMRRHASDTDAGGDTASERDESAETTDSVSASEHDDAAGRQGAERHENSGDPEASNHPGPRPARDRDLDLRH